MKYQKCKWSSRTRLKYLLSKQQKDFSKNNMQHILPLIGKNQPMFIKLVAYRILWRERWIYPRVVSVIFRSIP